MAPETVKTMQFSRFSDIWSLGCTIIEMATGQPPWFMYKETMGILYHLMNLKKPPEFPQHLSQECKDFLSHCFK